MGVMYSSDKPQKSKSLTQKQTEPKEDADVSIVFCKKSKSYTERQTEPQEDASTSLEDHIENLEEESGDHNIPRT